MSLVHYKFRAHKNYNSVVFDGLGISVFDLKREIVIQQKMQKADNFDLVLSNAETGEGEHSFLYSLFTTHHFGKETVLSFLAKLKFQCCRRMFFLLFFSFHYSRIKLNLFLFMIWISVST
jgi:DNA-directed RNA polymerase subunit N (RpoN/RPB10)